MGQAIKHHEIHERHEMAGTWRIATGFVFFVSFVVVIVVAATPRPEKFAAYLYP
jgi:hypothetical protein